MAWGRRYAATWSPVEEEYLRENRQVPINQLTIRLSKSRAAIKRKLDEFDGKSVPAANNKRTKIGRRPDILVQGKPLFLRSGWEANVARYLTHKGYTWEYEPEVFFFHGVKRGTNSYTPDFRTPRLWIEVKGQLDSRGRAALRRFRKHYPDEFKKLRGIVGRPGTKADLFFKELGVPIFAYINELNKEYKDKIGGWE